MIPRHVEAFSFSRRCGAPWRRPSAATESVAAGDIRQNLFSTCFASDQDGWVVGELGRIFHTTDGGKTFSRSDTGTSRRSSRSPASPTAPSSSPARRAWRCAARDQGESWETLDTGVKRELLERRLRQPAGRRRGRRLRHHGAHRGRRQTWTKIALPTDIVLPEDVAEIVAAGRHPALRRRLRHPRAAAGRSASSASS